MDLWPPKFLLNSSFLMTYIEKLMCNMELELELIYTNIFYR
jgi:hypothetical protein